MRRLLADRSRSEQRRLHQDSPLKTFRTDRTYRTRIFFSGLCSGRRNRRRDENQSYVFGIVEFFINDLTLKVGGNLASHELHRTSQCPRHRLHGPAIARPFESDDQAKT